MKKVIAVVISGLVLIISGIFSISPEKSIVVNTEDVIQQHEVVTTKKEPAKKNLEKKQDSAVQSLGENSYSSKKSIKTGPSTNPYWDNPNLPTAQDNIENFNETEIKDKFKKFIDLNHKPVGHTSDVQIVGEKEVSLKYKNKEGVESTKKIKLLKVNVSEKQKQKMHKKAKEIAHKRKIQGGAKKPKDKFPKLSVNLGMANVPVLDQGNHSSCVTFATTAAIDAKMIAGDYISQQCLLELGMSFGKMDSGWEGLTTPILLNRINQYGFMSKDSCPHSYGQTNYIMSPNEYVNYSGKLWANSFNWKFIYDDQNKSAIEQVKTALSNNHRVVLSFFLDPILGEGQPINGYPNGLYTLPDDMDEEEFYEQALAKGLGHAVVITGYDEELELFKIRNSWGDGVGDNGDFYITYDYFEVMAYEAIEII